MNEKKKQLRIVIVVLLLLGLGGVLYKNLVLGFSLLPEKRVTVWTVECQVTFQAAGGPVTISLNLPDATKDLAVLEINGTGKGYSFSIDQSSKKERRATWESSFASGEQKLFLQTTISRRPENRASPDMSYTQLDPEPLEGAALTAAEAITALVAKQQPFLERALELLRLFNTPGQAEATLLLKEAKNYGGKLNLLQSVMAMSGIKARPVKGLFLEDESRKQTVLEFLEIFDGQQWQLVNPRRVELVSADNFLAWQRQDESLLEIIGGSDGKATFSATSSQMLASRAAVTAGTQKGSLLVDFSIYTLPIADQNTFKLLLLIPIGALVVVILRNLVGLGTSGTFMPILIAMVFMQTTLIVGLLLFLLVVGVGLILRSYLSHLNLLLVPRISAVLVFVIFLYVAIAVLSVKLGFEAGLQVTFFPMIIISWTIERMSILWEEEGPHQVAIQGGGSLLSAFLIYLVMQNRYIGHLTYAFPEVLLILLAIIIMIGSYTGYRLSELRRFEPLVRK